MNEDERKERNKTATTKVFDRVKQDVVKVVAGGRSGHGATRMILLGDAAKPVSREDRILYVEWWIDEIAKEVEAMTDREIP